jgi:hypothetical protein
MPMAPPVLGAPPLAKLPAPPSTADVAWVPLQPESATRHVEISVAAEMGVGGGLL